MDNRSEHLAANDAKWSRRAASYDEKRFDYFRWMQKRLLLSAHLSPGSVFLDLGCGTGWAVRYAAELLAGNGKFVGVDISQGMLEKARANAAGLPNIEFQLASADDLPFPGDHFDTLVCSNSFHHYLLPQRALREVKRILKPHGRIHILDVTRDDFFVRWIDARARAREREHVKFYSTAEYAGLFAQAGLRHLESRQLNWMYPLKVHLAEKQG